MKRRSHPLLLAALFGPLLAAAVLLAASPSRAALPAAGNGSPPAPASCQHIQSPAGTVQMAITDQGLVPEAVFVDVGWIVTWTNQTAETIHLVAGWAHHVYLPVVARAYTGALGSAAQPAAASGRIESQIGWIGAEIPPGGVYDHEFVQPGLYTYRLGEDPEMTGWVRPLVTS